MFDDPDETKRLGMEMRERLLGPDGRAALDSMVRRSPKLAAAMVRLFATSYGDPLIDLRTRSLCTVTVLVAQGQDMSLANHLRGALRVGWSGEQLVELIAQLAWYVGLPSAFRAMRLLDGVIAESDGGS